MAALRHASFSKGPDSDPPANDAQGHFTGGAEKGFKYLRAYDVV